MHILRSVPAFTTLFLKRSPPIAHLFSTSPVLSMPPKDKYTDPKLRDKIKEEIQAGDKGGEPGQWSARKVKPIFCHTTACELTIAGATDGLGV